MIVGLTGQAQAGKDTTAEYLKEKYGFERIGMADPMKRFCQEVFEFSDEQLWGNGRELPDKRYGRIVPAEKVMEFQFETGEYLTARYALQTLGTEWGRHCYDNVWVDYAIRMAKRLMEGGGYYDPKMGYVRTVEHTKPTGVVFSDLRFLNEFEAVKAAGGFMVRIYRPGKEGKVGIFGHPSEEEQKQIPDEAFDAILRNEREGDYDFLYKQIEEKIVPHLKPR